MDIMRATKAFAALSQETRLGVFRLLVQVGGEGLPAGEIARQFEIPHNTMSSHLSVLAGAGLISSKRHGRSILYAIDLDGTRELMSFLMEDCCQGREDLCSPLIASLMPNCCEGGEGHKPQLGRPNL